MKKFWIPLWLVMGVGSGCQVAQMRLPDGISDVDPVPVLGANPRRWNTPIRFGSWSTSTAREGLSWDFGFRLLGLQTGVAFQPYKLVVDGESHSVQAECVTRNILLGGGEVQLDAGVARVPALACGFQGAGDGTLRLYTTATNAENGEARFGSRIYSVRSVRRFDGSGIPSSEPLGYELLRDGQAIAAVETINQGRVWMRPSLLAEDQANLAAVMTALLLYVPAEAGSVA